MFPSISLNSSVAFSCTIKNITDCDPAVAINNVQHIFLYRRIYKILRPAPFYLLMSIFWSHNLWCYLKIFVIDTFYHADVS